MFLLMGGPKQLNNVVRMLSPVSFFDPSVLRFTFVSAEFSKLLFCHGAFVPSTLTDEASWFADVEDKRK